MIINKQGKYREADLLYLRALDIKERFLGPDHEVVASSLGCLANSLEAQVKCTQVLVAVLQCSLVCGATIFTSGV